MKIFLIVCCFLLSCARADMDLRGAYYASEDIHYGSMSHTINLEGDSYTSDTLIEVKEGEDSFEVLSKHQGRLEKYPAKGNTIYEGSPLKDFKGYNSAYLFITTNGWSEFDGKKEESVTKGTNAFLIKSDAEFLYMLPVSYISNKFITPSAPADSNAIKYTASPRLLSDD